MRLLFVSNFYPPLDRGGYEKHCHEVACGLREKGHSVFVLTSRFGAREGEEIDSVSRRLYLESAGDHYRPGRFFTHRWWEGRKNTRVLLSTIDVCQPDTIVFWGMWNLSRRLPAIAEATATPVVYWIGDLWPVTPDVHTRYWRAPARRPGAQVLKSVAAAAARASLRLEGYPPKLEFTRAACGSQFLKAKLAEQIPAFEAARVVMCGTDLAVFRQSGRWPSVRQPDHLRVVYVGALGAHKGVHIALEAMGRLAEMEPGVRSLLTLVGSGHPDYERQLQEQVRRLGIEERVRFLGALPKEGIPSILAQNDVLVVPSVWEEPFGRVIVGGMAAGLVVVGTATGGSAEIVVDGVNGLVFPVADASALAGCLARLVRDPRLYQRLAEAGRQTSQRFDLRGMIDEMEQYLLSAVAATGGIGT